MILLIKLWWIRNTANHFQFTSFSIPVKTSSSDWLELTFLYGLHSLRFYIEESWGLAVGVRLEGKLGRDLVLGFSLCHVEILVCHVGSSRYTEEGSSSLLWLLSGALPCLALFLGGLNRLSPSARTSGTASWCSLCVLTQIYVIMKINTWLWISESMSQSM